MAELAVVAQAWAALLAWGREEREGEGVVTEDQMPLESRPGIIRAVVVSSGGRGPAAMVVVARRWSTKGGVACVWEGGGC